MSSSLKALQGLNAVPKGFLTASIAAGIKKKAGALDMAVIHSEIPCPTAGVFTTNKFQAAPCVLSKKILETDAESISSIVINAGCANACTGTVGYQNAEKTVESMKLAGYGKSILMSTGVIGQHLDMDKINFGIKGMKPNMNTDWKKTAEAIMTTDAYSKMASKEYTLPSGKSFSILGISKGAGMIHPNMATMLGVMVTDCAVSQPMLKKALVETVGKTFNAISVDGDTSTNDTVYLMANGKAGNKTIDSECDDYKYFTKSLFDISKVLSQLIVKDGEGATKLATVTVEGAASRENAVLAAQTICKSPLVKTAFYGEDANWGRILCAVGYSGVELDTEKTDLFLTTESGDKSVQLVKSGQPLNFSEEEAAAILANAEFTVKVSLGVGNCEHTMWTCDLTKEYISINADYRS